MSLTFANPALLWGTLLFSVPLIIHLLNRRRHRTIRWAAQEFLLQAWQRTRRRLTLESLLLLLLRCGLVALLALALARPFVPSADPLAVFTKSRRDVVLVMDTSYSMMRESRDHETALKRARDQARLLLDQLSEERGDQVTLMTLSDRPQVLQHESTRIALMKDAVDRLAADWRGADLVRTLDLLSESVLAPSEAKHEVFLFTDVQAATFQPGLAKRTGGKPGAAPAEAEAPAAASWRRAAAHDASFVVVDVGEREPSRNLSVVDLAVTPQSVVTGEVSTFTATVGNPSTIQQQAVTGTFYLGPRRERAKTVSFDVPAGGSASVEFSTVLREPGFSEVEFELAADELPADDRRFLAFPVRDAVRVLLVDGDYDRGEDLRATAMLADMLNPSIDPETSGTVFRLRTIDDRRFNLGAETLADYQLIVLADVPSIDDKIAGELADAVPAGAGLLIFAGEQLDPRAWNERLYQPDGSGLLPARFADLRGATGGDNVTAAFYPKLDALDHPVVELFKDDKLNQQLRVPVSKYYRVELGPKDGATQVILYLDDDAASPSPLILEKPVGHGRVALMTTSADNSWAMFADQNHVLAYLPLVQELATRLTLPDPAEFNLRVGDRLRRATRTIPSAMAVIAPSGQRVALEGTASEREYGEYVLPTFDRTHEPGLYQLELEFPLASGAGLDAGRRESVMYAVNVDVAESDLTRIDVRRFPELFPGVKAEIVSEVPGERAQIEKSREGDLWRPVLWIVLAMVVAEMIVAFWFGRRTAGAAA